MRVVVESLISSPVSRLVAAFCATDKHMLDMFDYCQTLGEVYTGFIDGEFVCCWGLIPPTFLSNQAYLWMWAPEPVKYQFTFIRRSQIQVQKMLERYEQIVGDCSANNRSAQRWLKWLGAEFEPSNGATVHFVIRRH